MANTTFSISDAISQGSLSRRDQEKTSAVELSAQFNPATDFAEASVYNSRGEFVSTTIVNIGINPPTPPIDPDQTNEERDIVSSTVYIDPVNLLTPIPDFLKEGSTAVYSFFKPITSNLEPEEISYDRTEIKVRTLQDNLPQNLINELTSLVTDSTYYGKVGIDHAQGEYTPIINVANDSEFIYL